jgi:hypothetical protein
VAVACSALQVDAAHALARAACKGDRSDHRGIVGATPPRRDTLRAISVIAGGNDRGSQTGCLPDGRSKMAAMIFSSPAPQFGQCCMSMSKAKLQRRPTCAQVMS